MRLGAEAPELESFRSDQPRMVECRHAEGCNQLRVGLKDGPDPDGLGFRVQGSGFRVQGSGFRVQV